MIALLVSLIAAPVLSADPWMEPYRAELRRQCPSKHLERMADAVLFDQIDAFKVSSATTARQQSAYKRECASETAGFSCSVRSSLHVLQQAGLTRRFAASVCVAYRSCEEQAFCTSAKR